MGLPQLAAITLNSFFAPCFPVRSCVFVSCFSFFMYKTELGRGGLPTWDADRWERLGVEWSNCLCVSCCCAGWFPHVPHIWSGAGIRAGKRTLKHDIDLGTNTLHVSSLFCSCCVIYLSVRCCEVTARSSTIWSRLKDIHRIIPSSTMWKVPISHRYPPSRHQLALCANDVARVQDMAVKMSVSASAFLIWLQLAVRNTDLAVPHATKIRATFPVNPCGSCLWGRSYFALLAVVTSAF